ncbi:type II secretion system minor pseudopilin GspI, partial [Piscinibacter sakaiensis]|uniref:type II secretion system minor pseudopilin GspI n=2 Tax=Piscinibacter sakaiensis TaxID=1547922 RepID=UPI000AEC2C0B
GFTLVEVLVALAVVAVTLGAGLQAAAALTRNAQRLGEVTEAQWCADNQITNLRLPEPPAFPGVGDIDFQCEQFDRLYLGKLVVRPTPNPNFRRIDAQVRDVDGVPLVTLSTVIGRY